MRGDNMDSWNDAMDKAIALCGSQKALAERLVIAQQQLTNAKKCRQPLPKEKLEVMAELIEADPAELWHLQEVANMSRRNPFLHAATAAISAFLCVVLSVGGNDAKADAYGSNSISSQRADYTLSIRPVLWKVLR